jgi:hypothetical protein
MAFPLHGRERRCSTSTKAATTEHMRFEGILTGRVGIYYRWQEGAQCCPFFDLTAKSTGRNRPPAGSNTRIGVGLTSGGVTSC